MPEQPDSAGAPHPSTPGAAEPVEFDAVLSDDGHIDIPAAALHRLRAASGTATPRVHVSLELIPATGTS